MADEKPQQRPEEESKKDTVRINLPPGLASRAEAPAPAAPPTAKLKSHADRIPRRRSQEGNGRHGPPAATPRPKRILPASRSSPPNRLPPRFPVPRSN